MKIDFENLGGIDKGSIELNDFTIFCGKNNSGKTYAMYSIYGLLNFKFKIDFDFVSPIVDSLKKDGVYLLDINKIYATHKEEIIEKFQSSFESYMPNLFGVTNSYFSNSKIRLSFADDEVQNRIKKIIDNFHHISGFDLGDFHFKAVDGSFELILTHRDIRDDILRYIISEKIITILFFGKSLAIFGGNFLLPAERIGINLFFRELFSIRNLSLQLAQNDNINPMSVLKDIVESRYAEPIKDYMQYLNDMRVTQTMTGDYVKYGDLIEKNILNGSYEVDEFNVSFICNSSKNKLPLHFSSSTVKTLFGLVFHLKHVAKKGNYLMIDEPELSLHPDNQRQVARVLAQLVNAGLKVIVSTHSNYFMREINNLIMLNNDFKGVEKLRKKYKYQPNELLNSKRISAYLFDKNEINPMKIDDEGIIAETFDTVTDALNQSSDDIYYTMQDAKEADD